MSIVERVTCDVAYILNSPGAKLIEVFVLVTLSAALLFAKSYQVPVCWKSGFILWVVTPKLPMIFICLIAVFVASSVNCIFFNPFVLATSKVKLAVLKIGSCFFSLMSLAQVLYKSLRLGSSKYSHFIGLLPTRPLKSIFTSYPNSPNCQTIFGPGTVK